MLEKSKEEETSMEDILLNIRDAPLDTNTPSPYELMFHRKVKSDLPSIPLSLFDSTNSINAGHRSVKHAERTNESDNRGEPPRLEQQQTVMFMKNLRTRRPDGQVGRLFQWTDNDHTPWKTTQPEHNIPETGSISSQSLDMPPLHLLQKVLRKEGKKVHQCQWKCQTPRLRLAHRSRSLRPP